MASRRVQIRKFVKPLLDRHPQLAMKGNMWIMWKPIHHFARIIIVDRTGGPERLIRWGVDFLFGPFQQLAIGFGQTMNNGQTVSLDGERSSDWFVEEAETIALPTLNELNSLEKLYGFVTRPHAIDSPGSVICRTIDNFPDTSIPLLIGTGRFAKAREVCAGLPSDWRFNDKYTGPTWKFLYNELYPLLLKDHAPALASILHRWEEETVRANRLEHLWERTPFPFEIDGRIDR